MKEVTDEPGLAKAERNAGQMHRAAPLSARAKLIKRADKVANVREAAHQAPTDWTPPEPSRG